MHALLEDFLQFLRRGSGQAEHTQRTYAALLGKSMARARPAGLDGPEAGRAFPTCWPSCGTSANAPRPNEPNAPLRFWPADQYAPGRSQPSFDKQFVRDYLETLDWNKTPPGPVLPPEVVAKTQAKYLEAYERLTGQKL